MQPVRTRRQFLGAGTGIASAAWIAANWPSIAAAAQQAEGASAHHEHDATPPAPADFVVLTAAEAADVDAIANQIVPGGDTPGARDARVVHFIDRALGSFFAAQLPAFRQGLAEFQQAFAAHSAVAKPFAAASDARQIDWLHSVDQTDFFHTVHRLTLLGLVASPKYGGNFNKTGWKVLGFDDRHLWQPPFGHYDQDYAGFEPYPGTRLWTAGKVGA